MSAGCWKGDDIDINLPDAVLGIGSAGTASFALDRFKVSDLLECLHAMPRVLASVDLRSVLTNGKVEIPLKAFMGITWVGTGARRNYLMDKRFADNVRFDLVAFEGGHAGFWIEAKCDFAADRQAAQKSAQCAVERSGSPLSIH